MNGLAQCLIAEKTYNAVIAECIRTDPLETGGVLIGELADPGIRIWMATGPGPKATHKRHMFKRDGISSQEALDDIVAASGGAIDYLGEWHSHPCDVGPSNKDLAAMKWIANNPRYAVATPILGLCIKRASGVWEFELFRCLGGRLLPVSVRVVSQQILSAGFMRST